MRSFAILIFCCLTVGSQVVAAEEYNVSHSYFSEYSGIRSQLYIAPDSQDGSSFRYDGLYQGQFNLKSVAEHPRAACSAADSYSAEFFLEQHRRRLKMHTPSGVILKGRVRSNGIFRVSAVVQDGELRRRLVTRGKYLNRFEIRVRNKEKVFFSGTLLCKFKYRSRMFKMSK